MYNKKNHAPQPTFDTYMDTVLDRSTCKRHAAVEGVPCWEFVTSAGELLRAICNKRARRAGFVGTVSADSTRSRR